MSAGHFKHDVNARNSPKMARVRSKYGLEGYGAYFAILEIMSAEDDYSLEYSDDTFSALEYELRPTFNVSEYVASCVEIGLFEINGDRLTSGSFAKVMKAAKETHERLSERAAKGAAARWGSKRKDPFEIEETPWTGFVKCFESNIGSFPRGDSRYAQELKSYFDELGAEMMNLAVEITNRAQIERPRSYLTAILGRWARDGVRTVEQAKEYGREMEKKRGRQRTEPEPQPVEAPNGGRFYR